MKTIENCVNALIHSLKTTGNSYTAVVTVETESGVIQTMSVSLKCNSYEMAKGNAEKLVKHFFAAYYPDDQIRQITVKEIRQRVYAVNHSFRWKTCVM